MKSILMQIFVLHLYHYKLFQQVNLPLRWRIIEEFNVPFKPWSSFVTVLFLTIGSFSLAGKVSLLTCAAFGVFTISANVYFGAL